MMPDTKKKQRDHLTWKECNAQLRDCTLDTARRILRDEQRGRKRMEFLRRIQHRVAKLEKQEAMRRVLHGS